MAQTEKERTLLEALNYAHLHELPAEWNKKDHWIKAIGLTNRSSGLQSYAILRMDGSGNYHAVKDFRFDGLRSIVAIYPYIYVDSQFLPKFTQKQTDEKHEYIAKISGKSIEEVKNLSAKEQKAIMAEYAIKMQLASEPPK